MLNTNPVKTNSSTATFSEEEQALNKELNLFPPNNVLTETLPLWEAFFGLMRRAYLNQMLTKENIFEHLRLFYNIKDANKSTAIAQLDALYIQKEDQISIFDELRKQDDLYQVVDDAIANLPFEKQQAILNAIATGEEEVEIDGLENLDISDEIVYSRLQNAISNNRSSGGFRVDGGTQNPVNPNPFLQDVLTGDQLEERFDLGEKENSSRPQNRASAPINRPVIAPVQPVNPNPQIPTSDVSRFTRPVKNLDQLTKPKQ